MKSSPSPVTRKTMKTFLTSNTHLKALCSPKPSLEKAMAPHSSTLAWKIPWMEEPGRLQSMGLLGVGHDWETSLSLFTLMHWKGNGNPLQCSCLENPRDGDAWWAAICGVAQSWTRLKWLSSSSTKCQIHKVGTIDHYKINKIKPVWVFFKQTNYLDICKNWVLKAWIN